MDYSLLARFYVSIESTSKRLEKTSLLAGLLKNSEHDDLPRLIHLVQGTVFPPWSDKKVGVAEKLVIKAMALSFGDTAQDIEDQWRKTGDLGTVAQDLSKKKKQVTLFSLSLSIKKVFENIEKLSTLEGSGTVDRKVQLIAELLTSAKPDDAKYIVRTVLGQLRAGLGEGTVRDALVWAFLLPNIPYDPATNDLSLSEESRKEYSSIQSRVQQAFDVVNDFSEIAVLLKKGGLDSLDSLSLKPGRPVKVMLFQKAKDATDAMETLCPPVIFEFKYDGFRMQIHKQNNIIKIFTRRLEEVTSQFPDVVDRVKAHVHADSFIIDAECIGLDPKSGRYLPFQMISQRIRRKYDIDEMARSFPVELRVFDILFLDGESIISKPFQERRRLIEKIIPDIPKQIAPAISQSFTEPNLASEFYHKALDLGMEGAMAKRPDAPYQPGSRVGFGLKVKPVMETLDLVIVAAEWGEGKRTGWLTSFTLACQDEDGALLEIGNVGTGFKEKPEEDGVTFQEMTDLLKPLIEKEDGRSIRVTPKIVLEVKFEEIQKSPSYSSGFALRFPRLVKIRPDKPIEEITTLDDVKDAFDSQK